VESLGLCADDGRSGRCVAGSFGLVVGTRRRDGSTLHVPKSAGGLADVASCSAYHIWSRV